MGAQLLASMQHIYLPTTSETRDGKAGNSMTSSKLKPANCTEIRNASCGLNLLGSHIVTSTYGDHSEATFSGYSHHCSASSSGDQSNRARDQATPRQLLGTVEQSRSSIAPRVDLPSSIGVDERNEMCAICINPNGVPEEAVTHGHVKRQLLAGRSKRSGPPCANIVWRKERARRLHSLV